MEPERLAGRAESPCPRAAGRRGEPGAERVDG
jgi:hypothetical protein